MPSPGRRLVVVAFASAVALVAVAPIVRTGVGPVLLAVNGLLLVAAAIDLVRCTRPAELALGRDLPSTVVKGGRADLVWTVRNPTGRPVSVEVADELPPSFRPRQSGFSARVGARRSARVTTRVAPARRGRFELRAASVRVLGPWGLVSRRARVDLPGVVRVLPEFRSRKEAELRVTRARILEVGLRSAKGLGTGTDFEALRDYGPDDDYRRIDWRATARSGRPIVRTYRAERNQRVLIMLDCGRVMAGRLGGSPRVEHAMDGALALCAVATHLGDQIGLVGFGPEVGRVIPPSRHRDQVGRLTEAMYDLEPALAESDYATAFAETIQRFRRRSLLVILTDLVEHAVEDGLLPALPLISRTHLVMVGAVSDPRVTAWGNEVPVDASAAFRKAAAGRAAGRREGVAARLRAAGAVVVDRPPASFAGGLADAYLNLKTTGRL